MGMNQQLCGTVNGLPGSNAGGMSTASAVLVEAEGTGTAGLAVADILWAGRIHALAVEQSTVQAELRIQRASEEGHAAACPAGTVLGWVTA